MNTNKEIDEDFVSNRFGYCFYEIKEIAFIWNLFVYPEHRGKGNARLLLNHVINEIRTRGYNNKIYISVDKNNNSLENFYLKMGLEIKK